MGNRKGYCVIELLTFLNGRRMDDVALAFITGLRPSYVRMSRGQGGTADFNLWRVTVLVDPDGFIQKIEQEVEVVLPDHCEHGGALLNKIK